MSGVLGPGSCRQAERDPARLPGGPEPPVPGACGFSAATVQSPHLHPWGPGVCPAPRQHPQLPAPSRSPMGGARGACRRGGGGAIAGAWEGQAAPAHPLPWPWRGGGGLRGHRPQSYQMFSPILVALIGQLQKQPPPWQPPTPLCFWPRGSLGLPQPGQARPVSPHPSTCPPLGAFTLGPDPPPGGR